MFNYEGGDDIYLFFKFDVGDLEYFVLSIDIFESEVLILCKKKEGGDTLSRGWSTFYDFYSKLLWKVKKSEIMEKDK